MHLQVHRPGLAKNFKCTEGECQKMFYSREGLHRHKLTHLGIHFLLFVIIILLLCVDSLSVCLLVCLWRFLCCMVADHFHGV